MPSKITTSTTNGAFLRPEPAKGISYFTPAQQTPAGKALEDQTEDGRPLPKLFTPLRIRGVEMPNRIFVSPMCQYSAVDGFHTMWHDTHYGGMSQRGPGLLLIEASAVQARGRITPECSGIWLDAHVDGLKRHVDFAHSQNALIGIQLAHAGRKASTVAPWLHSGMVAAKEVGGWPEDVLGPSNEAWNEDFPTPKAMSLEDIAQVKSDFMAGVRRSIAAGFDVIELHFAHGYLVSSFLSPAVNKRQDKYGGSFENRVRLALELVEGARQIMPESMPLFVRISSTDWLSNNPEYEGESWTVEQSAELAKLLAARGVDVLDVSSGGNHRLQKIEVKDQDMGYHGALAKHIKREVGDKLLVSTVGGITTGTMAERIISGKEEEGTELDLVAAGRMFQKNPGLVWSWADDVGVKTQIAHQIGWGFVGRAPRSTKAAAVEKGQA